MLNNSVRSAARALDLLEHLAQREAGTSLSETAAALSLPKSSTLMLLRTLTSRGYVTRDEADRYAAKVLEELAEKLRIISKQVDNGLELLRQNLELEKKQG